jgi:threonine synthase
MATALPTGGFNAGLSVEPSCDVATVSVRELTVSGELSRNEGAVVILIGSG